MRWWEYCDSDWNFKTGIMVMRNAVLEIQSRQLADLINGYRGLLVHLLGQSTFRKNELPEKNDHALR